VRPLVQLAHHATALQIERIVHEYRRADPDEGRAALARHSRRSARSYTDSEGMVVINARLSPEDGAVVPGARAHAQAQACSPPVPYWYCAADVARWLSAEDRCERSGRGHELADVAWRVRERSSHA
jgi:hypothetical protein